MLGVARSRSRLPSVAHALAIGCAVFAGGAAAEPAPLAPPPKPDDALSAKRMELRGAEDALNAATERGRKLEGDISTLAADRERLNQNLLEAARRLREAEERAQEAEQRLEEIAVKERPLVASLDSRRALIGEVLVVLQRIGRRPPPALLARPDDLLEAVRSALALNALLPQMRAEARVLQSDLTELTHLRESAKAERQRLDTEVVEMKAWRERLAPMIEERRKAQSEAQKALEAETERARLFASQATSLKDLIARMEGGSEAARRGAQAAREADIARAAADAKLSREQRAKALAAPFKDAARLAPAAAFVDLKGKLTLPISGRVLRRFGDQDGSGGGEKGFSIAARENAVVGAPSDGWVVYAGVYRSYGQLLIINAGGGYYVVLAGMSRTHVDVGRFVLAGEPVASMGDGTAVTAATVAIGAKQPILYVEFRKDGAAVDSSPWWAKLDTSKAETRKVGG